MMSTNFRTAQFLTRFGLRVLLLCVFSAFGNLDFGRSVAALLMLSACYCAIVATLRQERAFADTLTNWDEAACYGALYFLAAQFNQATT